MQLPELIKSNINKIGGKLNDKTTKTMVIIISILVLICICLGCTTVYFYRTRTSNTTDKLIKQLDEQSKLITEQRNTIIQFTSDIESAKQSIESANSRTDELLRRNISAREYVEQSTERVDELRKAISNNSTDIAGLIKQQQTINEFVSRVIIDYRNIKERLGDSSGSDR